MLVLDEAHLLPREYLQPCLKGISFLTKYLNSEALLLTATMPDYRELFSHFGVPGLETVDLIDDRADFALFRKCRYTRLGVISDAALLERACAAPSCLVVVNGRKAARALYTACPSTRKFHLSTWMTTLDRKRVIDEVRAALADIAERYRDVRDVPRDERVIVFSTSLIEAGVDFDFYTVFRELSGLDSILQAGGRCNREGRRDMADVYVFEREESVGRRDGDARASVTRELLDRYAQPDSPECVQAYYARLYAAHEDELTRRSIVRFAMDMDVFNESKPYHLPFRSYSRAFVMIDAPTYSIAVPQDDESRALIARLPYAPSAKTLRSLQKYCCSVSPGDFRALLAQRLVDVSESGVGYLKDESAYQRDTGIQFECRDMYY